MKKRCAVVVAVLFMVAAVQAAERTATARVQIVGGGGGIVDPIEISEVTEIDFGQLSNVNGVCTMSSGGVLSGSPGMNCIETETPGVFQLSGTAGAVVEVEVSGGQSVDGVTFNPSIDGAALRTLTGGDAQVAVVGDIELDNATVGVKDIPYTFTVNYQ